jgi:hypothetical protein
MRKQLINYVEFPNVKEMFYIIDLFMLLSIAYAMGTAAPWMPFYIAVLTIIHLIFRVAHYFVIREECYLYDWCYYATILDTVYILFFPRSYKLHLIYLCFSNGLQLWSVLLLKNALVVHRPDRITSLFLHNVHSFVAYFVRIDKTGRYIQLDDFSAVYLDYLYYGFAAYLIWFVGYLVLQNVIFATYIKKYKLSSLVDFIKSINQSAGAFLDKFNGIWKNVVFLSAHFALFIPSTLLSLLSLYSLKFHMLMCLVSLYTVIVAGSKYYTRVMKDSVKTD